MRALPLVDILAARIDRSGPVAHDHVFVADPHRLDQRRAGQRGGARAVDHHLAVGQLAARYLAGIDEAGRRDDRGAVLVVMHDGNVHPLAQGLLDDEAFGRGDVLQIDAAEARLHQRDRFDELVGIFGVEFEIDRIDVGEALEQDRLAFHHRLRGERAQIAEAENGGAVRNHRHEVRARGIFRGVGGILGDFFHRGGDAGRIGEAEIALRRHGLGRDDLDLTGPDGLVIEQRFARGETGLFFVRHDGS